MIKGEIQISDSAINLPPLQRKKNVEVILSEEAKNKSSIAEETILGNLEMKIHFTRLKRRIRCRSSNIL